MKIIFWLVTFLVVYAYMLYPILLWVFSKIKKYQIFKKSDELLKVSIVISAYNEEKVIEARIKNLLELDYPKELMEIIIASDGSNDKTNDLVKTYEDRGIKLIEYENRKGKAQVLNTTIAQANNGIIVLSDANTLFKRDAIKMLVRNFGDKRVGCVCGELRFHKADASKNKTAELEGAYWKYEVFLKRLEGRRGSLLGANGGIYAIRKELFAKMPSGTIVDDFVIPMKILENGYNVIYEPEAIAYEESAKTIVKEMARRVRIGAGNFQSLVLAKRILNPLRGFQAYAFWSHKVLRWFAPFFLTGSLFFNAVLVGERFYLNIFLIQIGFYTMALIGRFLSVFDIKVKYFGIAYYFVSMNIALLLGFFKFLTKTQSAMWKTTER